MIFGMLFLKSPLIVETKRKYLIDRWLDRFCEGHLQEGIHGDLEELYQVDLHKKGPFPAKLNYYLRALGFFRYTFHAKSKKRYSNIEAMWKNHFITAFRSLNKQRQYFLINSLGLTLAIACFLFATLFAFDEFSFDRFHRKSENIYRLYKKKVNQEKGTSVFSAETSGQMGPEIVARYPEAINTVRINPWYDDAVLSYGETNLRTKHLVIADSTLFDVFDFQLLRGNPKTALKEPSTIVLSASFAKNLFGNEDPMGKTVVGLNDLNYQVTGVVEDAPRNSHIQYDAFISWTTTVPGIGPLKWEWMNNWLTQALYTYVELIPDTDPEVLTAKMSDLIAMHLPERKETYFLRLQPLEQVHLYSDDILYTRKMKIGSIGFLWLMLITAVMVLLIAVVNYINISLAKASSNIKEVGVRKVIGAQKGHIVGRFLAETMVQLILATLLGVLAVILLMPYFNLLTAKDLSPAHLLDWRLISFMCVFILLLNFLIGLYPARLIAAISPSSLLKNSLNRLKIGTLRKVLLVGQYAISTSLIIFTILIHSQTDFLLTQSQKNITEQVIVIDIDNEVGIKADALKAKLEQYPNVISVSACRAAIGSGTYGTTISTEDHPGEMATQIFRVDESFDDTYDLKVTEGHYFRPDFASDSNGLVINRAFMDYLGWETAVGRYVRFTGSEDRYPVIGVIENFHFQSPAKVKIAPVIMYLDKVNRPNLSVRIAGTDLRETINYFESTWDEFADRTPFDFMFVDQWFQEQFKSELQMLHTSTTFAFISIFLCVLGLYGLTSLMLEQRIKEISIRKVLGAGIYTLTLLFNRQFIVLLMAGVAIAFPVSWWVASRWLEQFAYRIDPSLLPFLAACSITFCISFATVSLLTIRKALVNPARILKNE